MRWGAKFGFVTKWADRQGKSNIFKWMVQHSKKSVMKLTIFVFFFLFIQGGRW
jgi:hypothetical protein